MGLQNLVGISLEQITPAKEIVKRLLDAAARHIADAKVNAISAETRFTSAYTAIRMPADVGLHAHGYRTLTSKPGHHQTAIQTLPTTLGVDSQTSSGSALRLAVGQTIRLPFQTNLEIRGYLYARQWGCSDPGEGTPASYSPLTSRTTCIGRG